MVYYQSLRQINFLPEDIDSNTTQSDTIPTEREDNMADVTAIKSERFFNKILLKRLRNWLVHQGLWNMIICPWFRVLLRPGGLQC